MTDIQRQQALLAFADRSMARPVKLKLRAQEKRQRHRAQQKAIDKALAERDLLMRLWKRWRQDTTNTMLEGPYAVAIQTLIDFLETLTLPQEARLVNFVKAGPWQTAPKDVRFLVLRLIDAKLIALREKQELPPFDDALPGEPLTAFQQIRDFIR